MKDKQDELTPEEKQIVICGACNNEYDTYSQDRRCPHKKLAKVLKQDVCPECGGDGKIHKTKYEYRPCPTCKGTGKPDSRLLTPEEIEQYGKRNTVKGGTVMYYFSEHGLMEMLKAQSAKEEIKIPKDMTAWLLKRLNAKDASEFMLAISVGKRVEEVLKYRLDSPDKVEKAKERGLEAGKLLGAKEERERIKMRALQAIADEPEYPGDMPDELWQELQNNRINALKAMRGTVRLTKNGIAERFLQALKEGK